MHYMALPDSDSNLCFLMTVCACTQCLFQCVSGQNQEINMSYMLSHLHNGWQVDQAILSEEDRVLVIRFGHDWDPTCMKMDEVLFSIAEKVGLSSVCLIHPSSLPLNHSLTPVWHTLLLSTVKYLKAILCKFPK